MADRCEIGGQTGGCRSRVVPPDRVENLDSVGDELVGGHLERVLPRLDQPPMNAVGGIGQLHTGVAEGTSTDQVRPVDLRADGSVDVHRITGEEPGEPVAIADDLDVAIVTVPGFDQCGDSRRQARRQTPGGEDANFANGHAPNSFGIRRGRRYPLEGDFGPHHIGMDRFGRVILMSKSNKHKSGEAPPESSVEDIALERSLEGLFRLGTNRRFDARQSAAVGAVVTRAGYAVMRSLSDQGTISLGQVAKSCAMDSATASRQVSGLIDEGLVDRRVSEEDARAVDLVLTERGTAVYESIVAYRLRHLASILENWDDDDRSVLAGLVARLVTDLTEAPLPRPASLAARTTSTTAATAV
ncbi:unannotated protein [freshwater metagenome]|uniref:Unannotated protein n=1 Tax=freshwater metagenome TaxID=449393 RepID=A0A6J6IW29_9ZZZZ